MSTIILARMPEGNRSGRLGIRHQEYIKQNHKYETIGRMATQLEVSEFLVRAYCFNEGIEPTKCCRRKPKEDRTGLFDVDEYALNNFTI